MDISFYTSPSAMAPLFPEGDLFELNELAISLGKKAAALSGALHPVTREAVVKLVEPMNSYYSNLIEGHYTHPLDIERALEQDFSETLSQRLLQLESKAHIEVQKKMKDRVSEEDTRIASPDFILWLHEAFYAKMPEEFKVVKNASGADIEIVPGKLRSQEVKVGRHVAPASESLPDFMQHFEWAYEPLKIRESVKKIIAIAASHHRLAWIHPFQDGNGRVARLFTEAYLFKADIAAGGLWSISRGFARNKEAYYAALSNADQQRYNDYDGRGNLSNKALIDFCTFFLKTAIDQIEYMIGLLQIDQILDNISHFVDLMVARKKLPIEAKYVLQEAFLKGRISRGKEMERLTGKSENTARAIMYLLLSQKLLLPDTHKHLRINFPVSTAPYLFPNLYPGNIEATLGR